MGKLIVAWLAFVLVLLAAPAASARGRIVVPRGAPLELRPVVGSYEASFDVRNDSDDPLYVSRIAPRTDADDVRLPRRVSARFESGQTSGTIPPHGTARVRVTWAPDRDTHVRSFYGHVMITSTDESAGEVAVGIAAHDKRLGALGRHLLSTAVLLPMLASALLALLLVAAGGGRTGRRPRVVALVFSLACAAVALAAWAAFDPELLRADGGDGLQLVERAAFARSLGVEMFLGVDGLSLPLFVVCALAAPCGVLAAWEHRQSPAVFFALYMLLVGASLGALVALDGVVFLFCLALALAAAFLLVGLFGRGDARAAAGRLLVLGGLGIALVAIALGALHGVSTRTFLVDGTPAPHAWALPELARVDFAGARATLFGGAIAKSAFVLSFVGLSLLAAIFPFHAWLSPALRSAPPAVAALLSVGLTRAALLGVVRIDLAVVPDSFRWAAPALGALGAAGALYGAFVALGERNLASMTAFALVSLSGVALVGLGALTPEATLGAVSAVVTAGIAGSAAMLAFGALRDRTGTLDTRQLRGLGIEAPLLACAVGVAALGAGALPATAGFWTTWLVGLGAVVREPGLALAVLAGAVILAASQALPAVRVLRGRLPEPLRRGEALAPHGGRVPDLRPRELAAIAPLVLLILLLGFYPSPLLSRAANTARDLNELVNPPGPGRVE